MATEILVKGTPSRSLPSPQIDGPREGQPVLLDRFGKVLSPVFTKHAVADEGGYFTASMTPGQTALAYGVIAAFSDTAAFIVVQNGDASLSAGGTGKRIYLDYLRWVTSVIPATATAGWLAAKVDSMNRSPSANNALQTPQNVNMDTGLGSIGKVWFPTAGTQTVPASSGQARTIVGNLLLTAAIPVANDENVLVFGSTDIAQTSMANSTALKRMFFHVPPIIIGPQQYAVLHLWFPGNAVTGASFSAIDMGWWER